MPTFHIRGTHAIALALDFQKISLMIKVSTYGMPKIQLPEKHSKIYVWLCWIINGLGLHGVGEAEVQGGQVLLGDSQLHLHQEDSVGGGGGSGLFLIVTSIYKLCQLSALSASILRLPEQTKTGATEALSGLQTARADRNWCHSRERRLAAGLARGGTSIHLLL